METGDTVRIDLRSRTVNLLVGEEELETRRANFTPPEVVHATPWQEMYRGCTGQLETGACIDFATSYRNVTEQIPRHNH